MGLVIVPIARTCWRYDFIQPPPVFHGTTILSVRRQTPDGMQVAIGGDGQVTLGNIVVKGTARKRCASSTMARCLQASPVRRPMHSPCSNVSRPSWKSTRAIWYARRHRADQDWRTDRVLRRLEAMLAVADLEASLIITGNGDVLEPEQGIVAIGSGGAYAPTRPPRPCCSTPTCRPKKSSASRWGLRASCASYTNMHHTIETL